MRASELPELFGIVRTQSSRGPCLQLCTADYIRRSSHLEEYHTVQNVRPRYFENSDLTVEATRGTVERGLYCIRYKHPITGNLQEVYCWHLPLRAMRNDRLIPILDFQYRSWLPTEYDPFPIQFNPQALRRIVEELQRESLREIQQLEDTEFGPIPNERFYHSDPTIYGIQTPRRHSPIAPPVPAVPAAPAAPAAVPAERVVVQTLPKSIGEILLANARQGGESCPIAATPFKECGKICVTSCFHIFDSESLSRWQATHTSCPVCRTTIGNVVSE